jgi:signal transduction histidine kinase
LWAATGGGDVARFDGRRFERVGLASQVAENRFQALTSDSDDALWLCEFTGIYRWRNGELTSFRNAPELRDRYCLAAFGDSQGRVWFGMADGDLVVRVKDDFRVYSRTDGLPGGSIASIAEDGAGTIWVGSDGGLSRLDGTRFKTIGSGSGLPGESVRAIVADEEGNLWFGTSKGIVRLQVREFDAAVHDRAHRVSYALYGQFDGLHGVPMSIRGHPRSTIGDNGDLWFVMTDGVVSLNSRFKKVSAVPTAVVERLLLEGGREVDVAGPVSVPPLTSSVQIDYTGLTFAAPDQVTFRYRLEGVDRDWVDAGSRRSAFYSNLRPGHYRFGVVAHSLGSLEESSAVVDFAIVPTWYQTRVFTAAVGAGAVLALVGAWRLRLRRIQRSVSAVYAERARVAREIHDTLLQSLAGVALQFQELGHEVVHAPDAAKRRCDRLRELVNVYLREARQAIWDLRSPLLEMRDLAGALQQMGKNIAGQSARLTFSVTGERSPLPRRIEEALLRIGQEAVSNAVRHADATGVNLDLVYGDDLISLTISDNGRGFDTSAAVEVKHWGLATMDERVRAVGGKFRMKSNVGGGTIVEVIVPCIHGGSSQPT